MKNNLSKRPRPKAPIPYNDGKTDRLLIEYPPASDYEEYLEAFEAELKTEDLDYVSKHAGIGIALQRKHVILFGSVVNGFHCGFVAGYRFARKEILGIEDELAS